MDKKDFAFGRMNFILLAISMVIVVIGFILMAGDGSTDPIFSAHAVSRWLRWCVCLVSFQ